MHPCFTTLTIADGEASHRVSVADDAPATPAFGALLTDVERVGQSWRWSDDTLQPGEAEPCATDRDCRMEIDRCGALHALVTRTTVRSEHTCGPSRPTGGVIAACLDSRCVLAPLAK
jgi:hypothetical protein